MKFEVGKQYKWAEGTGGYPNCELKEGQVFMCHAVSEHGDCLNYNVSYMGIPASESSIGGWCVARAYRLNEGTVIPA